MKRYILLISLSAVAYAAAGQINYPRTVRLNDGWEFLREDLGSIWEAVRPVEKGRPESVPLWTPVHLPHCYNAEDAVDPERNYYQGPAWYKTKVKVENPCPGGRTLLHFEGSGRKTEVYLYLTKVASHTGGYDEWTADITDAARTFLQSEDAARFEGKIPLSIRCDNSRDAEAIPSDLSDFNIYGGIYRYLNLVYLPALSIDRLKTEASVDGRGKAGTLQVSATFLNPDRAAVARLELKVSDPYGKTVYEREIAADSLYGHKKLFTVAIKNPLLWSPDSPNLYTCEIRLTASGVSSIYREKTGFRHFEFVKDGPFLLNGKRLLLKGTHRHEDHAGTAAAMTEEQIVREMEMIKAMGANFIRLGHYQQSRIVLEQCDRLGILAWEEIPWCRGGLGGAAYRQQAREMLENMIVQHGNHPAVILWGLGNENDWPNDFPTFDRQEIRAFMTELNGLAHRLDSSRKTSIRRCDFCRDIVDVYSPSVWAGWYNGVYADYKAVSRNEMQQVSHFFHAEWGGDSHARRHAEDPYRGLDRIASGKSAGERAGDASLYGGTARASKDGDWSESYICDLIDWHLKEQENMPWLTGTAYWAFKDFSTPVRPENPVPYVNQKGVVERDLTPKESYHVFQSYWADAPTTHIYGHTWPVRWGDAGEKKTVKVYSNCETVELFLNGQSLGVKRRSAQDFPAAGLRWEAAFRAGENTLKAIGRKGTGKAAVEVPDEITFAYQTEKWGRESQIRLRITEDTPDYAWVEAEFQDANSVPCLDSGKYFSFDLTGDGSLVQHMGTSSASRCVQACNGRARIKALKNGGRSMVSVKSEGLKTAFLEL
jgi:beta-galactosidase